MKHVFLTVLIWLQLSGASAATVFYNDLAEFEAVSNTWLTDFDTFLELPISPPDNPANAVTNPATEVLIDGNVYSNAGNDSGVQICGTNVCDGNPFDSALIYAAGSGGSLRIELVAGVSAVGGIFGDLNGPAGSGLLSLFDSAGNLHDTREIIDPPRGVNYGDMGDSLTKTFFGWTSDTTTFSALEFMLLQDDTTLEDETLWAALDDLRFGRLVDSNGLPAVPLPAAFWLFLTAISGLLGLNRLRRT